MRLEYKIIIIISKLKCILFSASWRLNLNSFITLRVKCDVYFCLVPEATNAVVVKKNFPDQSESSWRKFVSSLD